MEENKKWRRHCLPYNLVLCYWCRGDRTTFSPSSLHKYWHWKKKLLNSIFHYRKHHVIDHDFFLNDVMTWSSKPLHSVICQALIGNHRKLQILDDLISEFSKLFDFWLLWDCWILSSFRIIEEQLSMLSLAWIIIFICLWRLVNLGLMFWKLSKPHHWSETL